MTVFWVVLCRAVSKKFTDIRTIVDLMMEAASTYET
jgi:hypothetical protein